MIQAYQADIDRLIADEGYQTVDVVSMVPDHPDKALFRQKFLEEHRHSEDEVRFSWKAGDYSRCISRARSTRCCAQRGT